MENLIKKIKKFTKLVINYIKWIIDSKRVHKVLKKSKILPKYNFNFSKILIVVPHADDELLGCLNILILFRSKIKLFYCGMLGSDKSVTNKTNRLKEFINLAENLNLNYEISSPNINISLMKSIKNYNPNLVLVPNFIDWHNDHREISILLKNMIEFNNLKIENIGFYRISVPIQVELVTHAILVSKERLLRKKTLFRKIYKSQKNLPIERFLIEDKIYGKLLNFYAAEVYSIYSSDDWIMRISELNKHSVLIKLDLFKRLINDISLKWKLVDQIEDSLDLIK